MIVPAEVLGEASCCFGATVGGYTGMSSRAITTEMLIVCFRSPPALGAALIILSLFVDPFFQQIIALGERQTTQNDNAVQIPRAVRYAKGWYTPTYSSKLEGLWVASVYKIFRIYGST
jgi:hypothetical protein